MKGAFASCYIINKLGRLASSCINAGPDLMPVLQSHPGQPYHAHNTLLVGQYGARIVTYSSVVKLWFTLRASARAVAPDSPILFPQRLWKESTPELVQVVKTE